MTVPHGYTAHTPAGSRYPNRESLLDFNPQIGPRYGWVFCEVAAYIAYLSLDKQVLQLNEAVSRIDGDRSTATRGITLEEKARLRASFLLLRDLLQIGWKIVLTGSRVQLWQEDDSADVQSTKRRIRESMRLERHESLNTPAVQQFVRFMERTRIVDDRPRSISSLIADGARIGAIAAAASKLPLSERHARLIRQIKPYLQLVEPDARDEFTQHRLMDIWRYFRLTWSIPYRSTPGRNMFYLVRDGGQPWHPIIGIAALGNCVIGLKSRDDRIGWTPDAMEKELRQAREQGAEKLHACATEIADLLISHLKQAISAIDISGITTANAIVNPSEESISEIESIARIAASERYEHLQRESASDQQDDPLTAEEAEPRLSHERGEPESSAALFRRKRAEKLANLLAARLAFDRANLEKSPIDGLERLLWSDRTWPLRNEKGRSALRTVLNAHKETKIGTSMMEIIVCGAVQPYNHLLGGKLVAMLLTSPQIVSDYATKYGHTTSTIASKVAGVDVLRPARIVYLGTSSLYASGADKGRLVRRGDAAEPHTQLKRPSSASQYNRVRIPADIAGHHGQVQYECIGVTEGYGSVHFSADTREALEELDKIAHNAKRVNSIFGEGTSPRMRKIRQGIGLLGLDDKYLIHGQCRLIYAVKLAHNSERYLMGLDADPDYIFPTTRPERVTKQIAQFWIQRWLSSRLDHQEAIDAVTRFAPREALVSREYHMTDNQQPTLFGTSSA